MIFFSGAKHLGEIRVGHSKRGRQMQVGWLKSAIIDNELGIGA